MKIEVLPSGSVVPAFQLLDAVNKGTLDGGHGVVAYHYGKNSAPALWGSGPSYGMDSNMRLSWHDYGGGQELLQEIYKSLNIEVVSFLYGPMPTRPFGWFKKPVARVEDMKGIKFRTVGLAPELKRIIDYAVQAASADMSWKAIDRNSKDYIELKTKETKDKVNFYKTSDAILRAAGGLGQDPCQEARRQPAFKKILRFAARLRPAGWPAAGRLHGGFQDGLEPLLRPQDLKGVPCRATGAQAAGGLLLPAGAITPAVAWVS